MHEAFRPDDSFEHFNARYPGLGEIKEGEFTSPGHWSEFCTVFLNKAKNIQAQVGDITPQDGTFLDHTSDIASQCIQYWIEKFYRNPANKDRRFLPPVLHNGSESLVMPALRKSIVDVEKVDLQDVVSEIPSVEDICNNPKALIKALDHMTNLKHSVRRNKDLRQPMIHYTTNIMKFIPLLAQYNEGLAVDEYIEARVRELINIYMFAE